MDLKLCFHNYSYWAKQLLAVIVIFSTILLINNLAILILKIWLLSSFLFILLLIAGLGNPLSNWWIVLTLKKYDEHDLDYYLLQLAQNMGSSISTYFLVKDYDTAFLLRGKKLIIGENVRKLLSKNELNAVLAHEFSHNTRKDIHDKIHSIGVGFTLVIVLYFALKVPFWMALVVMLACFYLVMSRFFWYVECDCDANAVKYVSIDDFASALSKVYEGKLDAFSFNHPSPKYRIKRIKSNVNQPRTSLSVQRG